MNTTKRRRTLNFQPAEKETLALLCLKYKSVLENKQTDGASWQMKAACWKKVEEEFNAQSIIKREQRVLKKKWENMKKEIKDRMIGVRAHARGTGGGPPMPCPDLEHYEHDIYMLVKETAVGRPAIFDSDADIVNDQASYNLHSPNVMFEYVDDDKESVTSPQHDFADYQCRSPAQCAKAVQSIPKKKTQNSTVTVISEDNISGCFTPHSTPVQPGKSAEDQCELTINSGVSQKIDQGKWSSYIPAMLRKKKNAALEVEAESAEQTPRNFNRKRKNVQEVWSQLGHNKNETENEKKETYKLKKDLLEQQIEGQKLQNQNLKLQNIVMVTYLDTLKAAGYNIPQIPK